MLPTGCQSKSINKPLIGCWPVRTGLSEESNYWPCGFKAAQNGMMKGDKERLFQGFPWADLAGPISIGESIVNQKKSDKKNDTLHVLIYPVQIRRNNSVAVSVVG